MQPDQIPQSPSPIPPSPGAPFSPIQGQFPLQQPPMVPPGEDPGQVLAIVGIIVGFMVLPLIGLIVCVIARNQSKKAGFTNNTLATIGIWIHGVLSALGILLILAVIALFTLAPHH